ncbi:MAG: four helix bundle protein [Candidatus Peribacteraceae bacterium]|nr:four helix bundle protein [Candidatus Peribacteraceae bacterium]MDD5742811.1 four helix bundle protein [Candidatus Peribacteraceae bacterium]
MTTFHSFEEIEAWKEARALTKKIRAICRRDHVRKDFAFIDQITRSVRSIGANIAEGFEASNVLEFAAFLGIAKRSAGETRAHMYDALDEDYVTAEEFRDIADHAICISKMLANLEAYLRSPGVAQEKKRTKKYVPQTGKLLNR